MVKVTLQNHENIQSHTRHLFLQHQHLSLTNVTWLLLTTQLLLTASLEEVRILAAASCHRQERCPMRQEWWGQSTPCCTILSIKTIETISKRKKTIIDKAHHFSWTTYAIQSERFLFLVSLQREWPEYSFFFLWAESPFTTVTLTSFSPIIPAILC